VNAIPLVRTQGKLAPTLERLCPSSRFLQKATQKILQAEA